ncbi:hypothetical protein FRC17_003168 [Serendipita sp. 399]|nr:hypothetical protein FRC17_003168 [Serendipita sp. 399]
MVKSYINNTLQFTFGDEGPPFNDVLPYYPGIPGNPSINTTCYDGPPTNQDPSCMPDFIKTLFQCIQLAQPPTRESDGAPDATQARKSFCFWPLVEALEVYAAWNPGAGELAIALRQDLLAFLPATLHSGLDDMTFLNNLWYDWREFRNLCTRAFKENACMLFWEFIEEGLITKEDLVDAQNKKLNDNIACWYASGDHRFAKGNHTDIYYIEEYQAYIRELKEAVTTSALLESLNCAVLDLDNIWTDNKLPLDAPADAEAGSLPSKKGLKKLSKKGRKSPPEKPVKKPNDDEVLQERPREAPQRVAPLRTIRKQVIESDNEEMVSSKSNNPDVGVHHEGNHNSIAFGGNLASKLTNNQALSPSKKGNISRLLSHTMGRTSKVHDPDTMLTEGSAEAAAENYKETDQVQEEKGKKSKRRAKL